MKAVSAAAVFLALVCAGSEAARLRRTKPVAPANFFSDMISKGKAFMALDSDMHTEMLVQVHTNQTIVDPCAGIACGSLQCPAGFQVTAVEGHCCPYCVNPAIKIAPKITGATGSTGGKTSAFCPDVWCFPTMCEEEEVEPTTANSQCCAVCPKK